MDDLKTRQGPEDPRGACPGRVLIVVPPHLPSRVQYFTGMLAGSGIEIVVDRRCRERRRGSGRRTADRRRGDRREAHRLFGYISGCRVVYTGRPAAG
jgi:hypothetical protein